MKNARALNEASRHLLAVAKGLTAIDRITVVVTANTGKVEVDINSYRSHRYFNLREVEGWGDGLNRAYKQVRDALIAEGYDTHPGQVPAGFDMKTQTGTTSMVVWQKGVGSADVETVVDILEDSVRFSVTS